MASVEGKTQQKTSLSFPRSRHCACSHQMRYFQLDGSGAERSPVGARVMVRGFVLPVPKHPQLRWNAAIPLPGLQVHPRGSWSWCRAVPPRPGEPGDLPQPSQHLFSPAPARPRSGSQAEPGEPGRETRRPGNQRSRSLAPNGRPAPLVTPARLGRRQTN